MPKKGYKQIKEHILKRKCIGEKNGMFGKHHTEKTKKIMRENHIGLNTWSKNRKQTKEHIKKVIESRKGYRHSKITKDKIGKANKGNTWGFTKHPLIGKDNPNYIDGRSFEEYPKEFNNELKEKIRKRDSYICQKCGRKGKWLDKRGKCIKWAIHHIDYNKKNCSEWNLITLCPDCNLRVNRNKKFWTNSFQELLRFRFNIDNKQFQY